MAWLAFLRRAGLGALLADDMGLGKTLQSLCALEGPSLVVPPTSVVHDWAAEAARFRPSLKVSLYHGPDRALDAKADLTVTSYALLRLDVKKLEGSSLQTGRHLHENDREGLEALARYCLRPPVAQGRLSKSESDGGKVVLRLRRPLAEGRTSLEMTPIALQALRR